MSINRFKMKLKGNKFIDSITRIICFPYLYYNYSKSNMETKKRASGEINDDFKWIKDIQNKYDGKRCFIIATGPSLKMEDLELLKNEYTFGMNSIVLSFDKTKWRPTFYAIQDEYVYEKIKDNIEKSAKKDLKNIWISQNIVEKYNIPYKYKKFYLHYLDHKMFHFRGYGKYKFSQDCYSCVYDSYSITFSIMQLACYMGFKEIYLLGCDCNYNLSKSHFVDYGHKDPKAPIMGDKMIAGHHEFKKFADSMGVKVFNCTRGGMLEEYPRKLLEDVIKNGGKNENSSSSANEIK